MRGANRFQQPGMIWHLTHRCHDRSFLGKRLIREKRWTESLAVGREAYVQEIAHAIRREL